MTNEENTLQMILDSFNAQNREMREQFEIIMQRQQETDDKLSELMVGEYKKKKRSENPLILDNNYNNSNELSLSCNELTLLPIFSGTAKQYTNRLDGLSNKRAAAADKLDRKGAKLEDTKDRIERLKDYNKMFENAAEYLPTSFSAIFKKLEEQNLNRIQKLEDEKIPKLEKGIEKSKQKINKLDTKIDITQSKHDKCIAMSGLIKSFAVLNTDKRRALFTSSVNELHSAQCRLNDARIDKANSKLDELCYAYDNAKSYSEANEIKLKQNKLYDKITKLNKQSQELKDSEMKLPFSESEKQRTDEEIENTVSAVRKAAVTAVTDDNAPSAEDIIESVIEETTEPQKPVNTFDLKEASEILIKSISYNSDMYSVNEKSVLADMNDNGYSAEETALAAAAVINFCKYEGSVSVSNRQWAAGVCKENSITSENVKGVTDTAGIVSGNYLSSVTDMISNSRSGGKEYSSRR